MGTNCCSLYKYMELGIKFAIYHGSGKMHSQRIIRSTDSIGLFPWYSTIIAVNMHEKSSN